MYARKNLLFTGTPCQIEGLYRFLQKDYKNLFTQDFVCHGVPSPKSWKIFLNEILKKYKNAKDVVWAQEEPKNMGAYTHMLLQLEEAKDFRVCSQDLHAAPAAGSSVRAQIRHEAILDSVFKGK